MGSILCTLFEGDYHYGLAALANSLSYQGYRGALHAGYKGVLPKWAQRSEDDPSLNWKGGKTLCLKEGLRIHFLPLETDSHLTNYKPDFMLKLLQTCHSEAKTIFYFDPDIVLISNWSFMEKWLDTCDIALFEDVNSPLSENHPKRLAWRKFFCSHGMSFKFKDTVYANGGFIGVKNTSYDFLVLWKEIQEKMSPIIGGLNRSSITVDFRTMPLSEEANTPYAPFKKSDQDALNATMEAWNGIISSIGKEGMAITPGEAIIPHALGYPKPWQIKAISKALAGFPPTEAQKAYWKYTRGVISAHSECTIFYKVLAQKTATLIGRFYRRG